MLRALAVFGAPAGAVTAADLLTPEIVAQLGVEPSRIDILTSIDGVEFDDAYPGRTETELDGVRVPFIGIEHLLQSKRATGRDQNVADVAKLEAAPKRGPENPRRRRR